MQYFKFYDKEQQQDINVPLERWAWVAIYDDDTELHQFDETTGLFHQFAEINQSKLKRFVMRAWHTDQKFTIYFNPETMKLIHFYRRTWLNKGTSDEQRLSFYFFGFEKNVNGTTAKSIMFIDYKDYLHLADTSQLSLFQ